VKRRRTITIDYEAPDAQPSEVDLSVEETLDLLATFHEHAVITDKRMITLEMDLPKFVPAPGETMACTYRLDPDDSWGTCSEDADQWVIWPNGGVERGHGEAACPEHRDAEEWSCIFIGDKDGLADMRRVTLTHDPDAGGTCTFPVNPVDNPDEICGDQHAEYTVYMDGELVEYRVSDYAYDMACPAHSSRAAWTEVLL